ncbi:MAG TPA: magnesium transporter [Vicinamibacterales bacterium]|nr:magnesium transporter [Vicinamibacterales bacterium]
MEQNIQIADAAARLDSLPLPEAETLFAALPDDVAAEVLFHLAPETKRALVRSTSAQRAAGLLRRLPADEAVEVVEDAGAEGERALSFMPPLAVREIRELLQYPPQTAGRLMTQRVAVVPGDVTAAGALQYLRESAASVETITTIYVAEGRRLIGVCSIRELLVARETSRMADVMIHNVVSVRPEDDQQEVARIIGRYDLPAVPVVDAGGTLLGIVTVDDVLDVLVEEFSEDYAELVGTDAAEMERRTPAQVAGLRLPWLLGTMGIELGAGVVIARFNHVLEQFILLASFMPVISAVSGNVGLQAAAIAVRGLDTGHIAIDRWREAVRRELATALTIAAAVGTTLGAVAIVWSGHTVFGLVVGAAMICAVVTAAFMGTVIPLVSKRLGFDPAATAGPFETALQDLIGFTVFLTLASRLSAWLR